MSASSWGSGLAGLLLAWNRSILAPICAPGIDRGSHTVAGAVAGSMVIFFGPFLRWYWPAIETCQFCAACSLSFGVSSTCMSFSASAKVWGVTSGPTFGPVPKAGGAPGGSSGGVCVTAAAPARPTADCLRNSRRSLLMGGLWRGDVLGCTHSHENFPPVGGSMRRALLVFVFAVVSFPRGAWPQGQPVGPEFLVNTYTTGVQGQPVAAMASSGDFVVVWTSLPDQDGSGYGIFGQRYDSSGASAGPEFPVNSYTTGLQFGPSVTAAAAAGDFVAVWMSAGQDGSGYGVFGQRYAGAGTPLGPEFRVNGYTTTGQSNPSVVADSAGNFVVVWQSSGQDGSGYGVFGQRYASSGAPLGPEFRVNTYTTGSQVDPAVGADSSGNFVVTWAGDLEDGSG